jgi:Esterase-like activity of phytase
MLVHKNIVSSKFISLTCISSLRSSKGNEPENVAFGLYGKDPVLFVNSERSSLVFVYDVSDPTAPVFKQALPAGLEPEGGKAIPHRNLYVVASETDERDLPVRAGITIYERSDENPMYPTLVSEMNEDGNPIPFSALSGLAAAEPLSGGKRRLARMVSTRGLRARGLEGEIPEVSSGDLEGETEGGDKAAILYAVEDSFFTKNRVFEIDISSYPYRITNAMHIKDSDGVFAFALGEEEMKGALINEDNTVNIDPEGVAVSQQGGFWLVHEGSGTVGDEAQPFETPNVLFKLSDEAVIEQVILLPAFLNEIQVRFGFEGVAEDGDHVVVCFVSIGGLASFFLPFGLLTRFAGYFDFSNVLGRTKRILDLASSIPKPKSGSLRFTRLTNQNHSTVAGWACPTLLRLATDNLWSLNVTTREAWMQRSSVFTSLTWETFHSKMVSPFLRHSTWT